MKFKFINLLFLTMLGCSTYPGKLSDYKPVPSNKIYNFSSEKEKSNVVITRDLGNLGSMGTITFFINGEKVANFNRSEIVYLKIPIGNYIFGAGYSLSGNTESVDSEAEFKVTDDQQIFRIYMEANVGIPKITKTSQIK